jgi:hypothetical protein
MLLGTPQARAHVVLAQKTAPAGSYYRAQFSVSHGCKGLGDRRRADRVPVVQPKAGWTLSYQTGPLAEPAMVHGKQKTEGIRRVTWSGRAAADEQFDEFGMMLFLAKPGPAALQGAADLRERRQRLVRRRRRGGGARPQFPAGDAGRASPADAAGGRPGHPPHHAGEPAHEHSRHSH